MITHSPRDTAHPGSPPRRRARAGEGASACLATLVLALATGVPLQSAANFLPHSDEQETPYLGV